MSMGNIGGYSISQDMANISTDEAIQMATKLGVMVDAESATAQSFENAERPDLASAARQLSKQPMPDQKIKKPEKTTEPNRVFRKVEAEGLEKELDQQAQNFVEEYKTMKKDSLLGLRKAIKDLDIDTAPENRKESILRVIEEVSKSYTRGHEAEADHAFDFLLQTTTGDLRELISEAKDEFAKANAEGIERGLKIEQISLSIDQGGIGLEGKVQNLNEKFVDLVAMEADTLLMDEQLLSKVSEEECKKILSFFTSTAGEKMRTTDVGPEMMAIWGRLQAIQGHKGVAIQIERVFPGPHYERGVAEHLKHIAAA